jgi:RNAse (barnase) inhibitor barstar
MVAMQPKPVYEIDGSQFSTLEGFYDKVSQVLIPGANWGRNLDAFNDILRGGFGTPEGGFVLRWKNSKLSRERLGATDFDGLVETIAIHTRGGREEENGVELVLA